MALDFPNNPNVDDTFVVGETEYKWDGTKWKAQALPLQAPVLSGCTLTENNITGNRFSSETFDVTAPSTNEGSPASSRDLKVEVVGGVLAAPETDTISTVGTLSYQDNFTMHGGLNDNAWSEIVWAGPPFNCYVAAGGGSSTQNMAYSYDGRTWTRFTSTYQGASLSPSSLNYQPTEQKIYCLLTRNTGGSNHSAEILELSALDGVWTRPTQNMPSRSFNCSWGHLVWDATANRWGMIMTSVQNIGSSTNTTWLLAPVGQTSPLTNWSEIGGGNNYQAWLTFHQNGQITSQASGWNNGNWWNVKNDATTNDGPQNLKSVNIGSNNPRQTGSTPMLAFGNPVVKWGFFTKDSSQFWSQTGSTLIPGSSPFSYDDIRGGVLTASKFYDSLWIEDLGLGFFCGYGSDATRTKQGLLMASADGTNWNFIWTNPPGDTSEYTWSKMCWDPVRKELLLVALGGNNPGVRVGYSKTVTQTLTLTDLTLATNAEFDAFTPGQAITQSDGNAEGVLIDVDPDLNKMAVQTTSGTWTPGQTIDGDASSYGTGYLGLQSDGTVTGVLPSDPGWTRMNGTGPWTLTFPASFPDTETPDDKIPSGSGIKASARAISEVSGFTAESVQTSAQVTPTS